MRSVARDGANSVLERALLVLRAFSSDAPVLRLPELVQRTALPKATVYRLTAQLEAVGLIEREDSAFRLGIQLFEMGQLAPRRRAIHDAALASMYDLRDATQETVHLAVLEGTEVVYIDKIVGQAGPTLPSRAGGRMPLYCTGVGKALLAFQPEPVVRQVIANGLTRRTPYTICVPGFLMRELSEVRRTGLAYEREESKLGVVCVASPIMIEGHAVASISISGWANTLDTKRVSAAVRSAALAVSRELGRSEASTSRSTLASALTGSRHPGGSRRAS